MKTQGTQTTFPIQTDVSVNTDITFPPHECSSTSPSSLLQSQEITPDYEFESDVDVSEDEGELDESFVLASERSQTESDSSTSDDEGLNNVNSNFSDDIKVVVFVSSLKQLFRFCFTCNASASIQKMHYKGSALVVTMLCTSSHETTWCSQPSISGTFAGNLLIPASILFTGATFSRFKEICDVLGMKCPGKTSYHKIQRKYLFPCIHKVYKTFQATLIDEAKALGSLNVSGNARCDSPGYNAKYSTYSLMNLTSNQVIDFPVVHVGTVENSSRMEKEGLIKVLDKVETLGIGIRSLTTDRHPQVIKYMREQRSHIIHQFDIWHFSKSIKKALVKAAKKKDCDIINKWIKSIINHFWWSCLNCSGEFNQLKERWISIIFHISNRHKWVGYEHFHRCVHPKLKAKRSKKWIKEGTKAYCEVERIVKKKKTLKDLRHCTEFRHSGNLEVYHYVFLKYCPKRIRIF